MNHLAIIALNHTLWCIDCYDLFDMTDMWRGDDRLCVCGWCEKYKREIRMELFLKIDDITIFAEQIRLKMEEKKRKEKVKTFKVEFIDREGILKDKRTFHAVLNPSYIDLITDEPDYRFTKMEVFHRYNIFIHRHGEYNAYKVLEQFREAKIYLWQAEGILENLKRLYDEVNKPRKGRPKNE